MNAENELTWNLIHILLHKKIYQNKNNPLISNVRTKSRNTLEKARIHQKKLEYPKTGLNKTKHTLSDCNWTRTHNHLVRKRTLNHLFSLAKWLNMP